MDLAVVIPAHNSACNIASTIDKLSEYFQMQSLSGQVIIVENGSSDNTWTVMENIDASVLPFRLTRTRSSIGLGNAIREGLLLVDSEFVLITADDLPFGFSDLNEYMKLDPLADIAVGSKAHAQTKGSRSILRKLMSSIFRILRRIIVEIDLGDTQGSIIGKSSVICGISARTSQPGYLMSTEFLVLANNANNLIIELPVIFRSEMRKSNIKIFEDSFRMLKGLFEIRRSI